MVLIAGAVIHGTQEVVVLHMALISTELLTRLLRGYMFRLLVMVVSLVMDMNI